MEVAVAYRSEEEEDTAVAWEEDLEEDTDLVLAAAAAAAATPSEAAAVMAAAVGSLLGSVWEAVAVTVPEEAVSPQAAGAVEAPA